MLPRNIQIHFFFFPFILVGPGLGALTADYRDAWAKNREHLRSLSEKNKAYLEDIETAMAIVILDQDVPTSTTDCCRKLMVGDTRNRFWPSRRCFELQLRSGSS